MVTVGGHRVENLSLFALIYLRIVGTQHEVCWESFIFALIYLYRPWCARSRGWESFIIRLDILTRQRASSVSRLRIFHYSPWYTYARSWFRFTSVENLSLFALIYLSGSSWSQCAGWESFIIRLDILRSSSSSSWWALRIFHYSPWYTYAFFAAAIRSVENLSLFALIYLLLA